MRGESIEILIRERNAQFAFDIVPQGAARPQNRDDAYAIRIQQNILELPRREARYWTVSRKLIFPFGSGSKLQWQNLLRFYRSRARNADGSYDPASAEVYAYASILPFCREIGANRVLADAYLAKNEAAKAAEEIQSLLAKSSGEQMEPERFAALLSGLIGPPRIHFSEEFREMQDQIGHLSGETIATGNAKPVQDHWRRWKKTYIRRKRHEAQIRAMDELSAEARCAMVQVYSVFWQDILTAIGSGIHHPLLDPLEVELNRVLHLQWRTMEQQADRFWFNGYSLSLHPATSLLLYTTEGRSLLHEVVTQRDDPALFCFMHGMGIAINIYARTREEQLDRQKTRKRASSGKRKSSDQLKRMQRRIANPREPEDEDFDEKDR